MRIAVVSDIHGNLVALEAVLSAIGEFDQLWCLGDIVGYGPRPNECVARLAGVKHLAVAGNHDFAAIGKIGVEDFNPYAARAAQWTAEQLDEFTREYLSALQSSQVSGEFTLVHGSPRGPIWEYVLNAGLASENLAYFEGPFCLVGHTHVPAIYRCAPDGEVTEVLIEAEHDELLNQPGWRFILNPGSVGQPRDDDPRASYLLIDTDTRMASWRRVEYDIAETQQQMRHADLPTRLVERLAHGW